MQAKKQNDWIPILLNHERALLFKSDYHVEVAMVVLERQNSELKY